MKLGRRAFSDADREALIDGLLASCDGVDGLRDDIVSDPIACRFHLASLACPGEKADGCLSGPQADALIRAFAGPKDSKGRQVYPSFPFDTGIAATQGIPGLLAGSMNPVGRPFTGTEMDVDARLQTAAVPLPRARALQGETSARSSFGSRADRVLREDA